MTEAPHGGKDSRLDKDLLAQAHPEQAGPDGTDTYALYRRGIDLLGRGSAAAAAQLLERAVAAEPRSPSVLEALARAQFDARRYADANPPWRSKSDAIWFTSPHTSDSYAEPPASNTPTTFHDPLPNSMVSPMLA